ncbi:MAG: hypothetical protein JMN24_11270 [gamma proteobacterium endosymbiont of Lamellibrachia anaximandri]|nr:hypothetical protein [gamma proteobacterium endosymbiont of Lamellibrachia anaximandri]MBL3618993.1 hypothetical protein [gamma proteobacterium endosymbiont of Lamellibrachia anaximandri]
MITWKQLLPGFLEVEWMFVVDVSQTKAARCLVYGEDLAGGVMNEVPLSSATIAAEAFSRSAL